MSRLLHIKASPRGPRSFSTAVADIFIESYKIANPADEIVTLDLFKTELPPFDGLALDAKYVILHGEKHTKEQLEAWRAIEKVIETFKAADKYVLSTPMWNFSIPYKLKHLLDVIVQPTYTFSVSPEEGYKGLVTGKPIVVVYSRGGQYPPGSPSEGWDLQSKYIQLILGFMGFTDIRPIVVEPTLAGPEAAKTAKDEAIKKARDMAIQF